MGVATGRLYDPLVGRFLNPDNFVQQLGNTQSYNRYSYCLNNPLKYTDPSGNNYKPDYWNEGYRGMGISTIGAAGRFDFSATNARANMYYANSNYTYEGGVYYNGLGQEVGWQKAVYGTINNTGGLSVNNALYETVFQGRANYAGNGSYLSNPNGYFSIYEVMPIFQVRLNAQSGGGYYKDPMFYINGGIGVASTGATIKGGYHLSNELYHYTRSSGNLHFRGGKYWNNPFVNNSKAAIAARGGAWRSAGTKLGYAGIAITTGDALMSGEFRTSQGINVAMTTLAIAVPGVGSIVAGVYFVADIGLTLSTGRGIGDRIDAATGGTHELYNGLY
ncbi:MAG: RHS repeat-associated core domain-containing protein [Prolixibacteraceae bacterium]